MAIVAKYTGSVYASEKFIGGNSTSFLPAQDRTSIIAAETIVDWIPLHQFRVWDTGGQALPATAANDDLALIHGTWGTAPMYLSAGDLKAAGATTRYARAQKKLKDTYIDGGAVSILALAGMNTTLADTSCVLNIAVYKSDEDFTMTAVTVAESNVDMNTDDTYAVKTFTLTAGSLLSTTELDIRVAITCTDGATVTAVTPVILGVGISQACRGG